MTLPKRLAVVAACLLAVCVILVLTSERWLSAIGYRLMRDEAPVKADAILVLAGDFRGHRILKACELLKQGFAPLLLVSGPMDFYGTNEADLAIRFAQERGCPVEKAEPFRMRALSTFEEAIRFQPELERRGFRNILIVTSNFHTARAGRIFEQRLNGRVQVRMVAAPDPYFGPGNWWHSREGQKVMFYEYSKAIAAAIGL